MEFVNYGSPKRNGSDFAMAMEEETLEKLMAEPEPEEALPSAQSDDDCDTDLEDEKYSFLRKPIYPVEGQTKSTYIAACRKFRVVPTNCFLKGLDTRTINVSHQGLGPLGTKAVATALVNNQSIEELHLAGNPIGQDGIRYVSDLMRENDSIKYLDLSETELDTFGAEMLAAMFLENDTLVTLKLSGNRIKGGDAVYLSEIIGSVNILGLRELDLAHNELGDVGGRLIGHAIADNETLVTLNLSWNQIRRSGITCIGEGITENNALKELDLSGNGVGNEGAKVLGKALEQNRTLDMLDLSSNRVGAEGVACLFKSLGINDNLKTLKLTHNPITLHGPLVALELLDKSDNCSLTSLEIADVCVPRQFFEILESVQVKKPHFDVQHGGFMDYRELYRAEMKFAEGAWAKDPVLVFIHFIDDRKIRLMDMFKHFDKDKSCSLSKEEFSSGLKRIGCPLDEKQLAALIGALDVDKNGEIDLGEFLDGHDKHKRRLSKYVERSASRGSPRISSASQRPTSSTRPPSRPSSRSQSRPNTPATKEQVAGGNLLSASVQVNQHMKNSSTSPMPGPVTIAVPKSHTIT